MEKTGFLPCSAFFNEGRFFVGLVVLLMQVSLVFWPLAIRWARNLHERSGVERMLYELSETHRLPADPYAAPMKRFRQAA